MEIKNSNNTIAEEHLKLNKIEERKNKAVQWTPLIVLITLIIGFSILSPRYFTFTNAINILNQISLLLPIASGLTFVIMMGSMNLAVEGIVAMCGSIMSILVLNNRTDNDMGISAVLIILFIGILSGAIIGLLHVKLKLPSFMVTFAFSYIGQGVALLSYGGFPPTINDPVMKQINSMTWMGIPMVVWIAIGVFLVLLCIERCTTFGPQVLAVGANEKALRSTGVNVDNIKLKAFIISGLCFAIAGFIAVVRLGRGEAALGKDTLFPAITAVVIGGTPLAGGKGGLINTLVGVLIMAVLQNGMIMLGISPYVQSCVEGVIIVVAVAFTVLRGNKIVVK